MLIYISYSSDKYYLYAKCNCLKLSFHQAIIFVKHKYGIVVIVWLRIKPTVDIKLKTNE